MSGFIACVACPSLTSRLNHQQSKLPLYPVAQDHLLAFQSTTTKRIFLFGHTMAKSRSKGKSSQTGRVIPLPPVIYLNDGASTGTPDHALAILKLLPDFKYSAVTQKFSKDSALTLLEATNAGSTVAVCISGEPCASTQIAKHSKTIKKLCIESGRNFLSVNIYKSGSTVPKGGTAQHLNHAVSDTSTPSSTAKDVMEWLCTY